MAWTDIRDGNPLKRALAAGEVAVGSFVRIPSAESVEVCAAAGCDFVVIDTEHAALPDDGAALVRAADAAGTVSIVRTVGTSREIITRALDTGAGGVQIPQLRSVAQAEAAIAATRYLGGTRGTASNRRSGFGLRIPVAEYVRAADAHTVVVLQVEDRSGLDAADEIGLMPGYDVLFAGVSDLAVALGVPGDWDNPVFTKALERIRDAALAGGKVFGVPVGSVPLAARYMEMGARFIATGDLGMLGAATRGFVDGVRECSA